MVFLGAGLTKMKYILKNLLIYHFNEIKIFSKIKILDKNIVCIGGLFMFLILVCIVLTVVYIV